MVYLESTPSYIINLPQPPPLPATPGKNRVGPYVHFTSEKTQCWFQVLDRGDEPPRAPLCHAHSLADPSSSQLSCPCGTSSIKERFLATGYIEFPHGNLLSLIALKKKGAVLAWIWGHLWKCASAGEFFEGLAGLLLKSDCYFASPSGQSCFHLLSWVLIKNTSQ